MHPLACMLFLLALLALNASFSKGLAYRIALYQFVFSFVLLALFTSGILSFPA